MDAFSEWRNGDESPFILYGADKGSAVRSRFDIAHELGHLMLHRGLDPQTFAEPATHKRAEMQAHRFAGALLLPKLAFAREVFAATLDTFLRLKPRWRVSVATMIHRAGDLGLVGREQAKLLWIYLNRRGWRKHEPLDDDLPVEAPQLLRHGLGW